MNNKIKSNGNGLGEFWVMMHQNVFISQKKKSQRNKFIHRKWFYSFQQNQIPYTQWEDVFTMKITRIAAY